MEKVQSIFIRVAVTMLLLKAVKDLIEVLPINLEERICIEGQYSNIMTGGSMCFLNLDSEMDEEQSFLLHKYIYRNSMINQWCPNYGWSVCEKGHLTNGEIIECPDCGSNNISHYERVVGYLVRRDKVNPSRELEMLNRVRHQNIYI